MTRVVYTSCAAIALYRSIAAGGRVSGSRIEQPVALATQRRRQALESGGDDIFYAAMIVHQLLSAVLCPVHNVQVIDFALSQPHITLLLCCLVRIWLSADVGDRLVDYRTSVYACLREYRLHTAVDSIGFLVGDFNTEFLFYSHDNFHWNC